MVRAVKNTTTTTAATATKTTTPVVETVSASTEKKEKAPRVKKTKDVVAATVPAVVTTTSTQESIVEVSDVVSLGTKMTEFSAKLQQLVGVLSTVKNDFKTLEKTVSRELKQAQKVSSKKRRTSGNRQPSGFVKPTRISDELAQFLGKEIGTEMARTAVSKEINLYIRSNSLQDKDNGRKINPDNKLSILLKVPSGEELTYFNLQKYMKHHFIKADALAAAAAAAVASSVATA